MKLLSACLIFFSCVFLIAGFLHPITSLSQDLGRHLKTGEIILQQGYVPKVNLFSYTFPSFLFINHHWLSEVIFYKTVSLFGFSGLLALTTLVVLSAWALPIIAFNKQFHPIALCVISFFYIQTLFERTDVRPEMFSFLFLSLFVTILYWYYKHSSKIVLFLPLIELVWVNTHIYFIVGILLFLMVLLAITIRDRWNIKKHWYLFVSFILCILATCLNPNGIQGALLPFVIFNNYGYSIEENQNIFFLWQYSHKPTILYFSFSVLILFTSLVFSGKKRLIDWIIAICFTLLAINQIRNFPLFVFATLIPCLTSLSSFLNHLRIKTSTTTALLFVLLSILLFSFFSHIRAQPIKLGIELEPKSAADFFLTNNIKGPLFNNFDIGSYLDYRLFPTQKVFVDGRPEAYPSDFFTRVYIPMQENSSVFDEQGKKYEFNSIFFSHTDQTPWGRSFLSSIMSNNRWKLVFLDDLIAIFVKDNPINKNVLAYSIDEQHFSLDPYKNNQSALLRLANFFQESSWKSKEISADRLILENDSSFCPALSDLTQALYQNQDKSYAIYSSRYQATCL